MSRAFEFQVQHDALGIYKLNYVNLKFSFVSLWDWARNNNI